MRLRTKLFFAWSGLVLLLWGATLWQVQRNVTMNFELVADDSFVATRRGVDAVQAEQRKRMRQAGWLLMNIPELRALIAEAGSDLSATNLESLNERLDSLSDLINVDMVCVLNGRG